MLLKVNCPKCKHNMNYEPRGLPSGKNKRCVYCGKTFKVYGDKTDRIIKRL